MAQIEFNPDTGLFEAVISDQESSEGEVLDDVEVTQNILDNLESPPMEDTPEASAAPDAYLYNDSISLMSAVPSNAAFTPNTWQTNLASNRSMGEHYLMYANRVYYSGSSSYWHYFLVLGDDIEYETDTYTYTDCDVYSYYSYGNTVYYDRSLGSGSLNGNSTLVYSDLYFDYVGVDPAHSSSIYVIYALLAFIAVLLMIRGKR